MDLGHNADGVVHVGLHLITTTMAGAGALAVNPRIDCTWSRRYFGPKEPRYGRAKPLCTATGTPVAKGPRSVRIFLVTPPHSEKWRLRWTDQELAVIPAVITLEQDDDLSWIHDLDLLDGHTDLRSARECDGRGLPAMNVSWYPEVDTGIVL